MSSQSRYIPASSLQFLKSLKENNNREWFNAHKDEFLEQQSHIEIFAGLLLEEMNMHDLIETVSGKKSLHRIYRYPFFEGEDSLQNELERKFFTGYKATSRWLLFPH